MAMNTSAKHLKNFIYGLAEINRKILIKNIAVPGCYPTYLLLLIRIKIN